MLELPLVIMFVAIMLLFGFLGRFYDSIKVDKINPRYLISKELRDTIPSLKELIWREENGFAGYDYVKHKWKTWSSLAGRQLFGNFNYQ